MSAETCWRCHCGHEASNPEKFAVHAATCKVPHPRGWFDTWDGVSLPIAGKNNNGPTTPGEVIIGWRKRVAA